ncbi:YD repeat-containing protein [Lysobacter sp. yr284]|uniref:RHS repeat protein n=1 Tax=Lysobacter sp. yr284 TaxID=1761791 RepID=UPI000897516B|nr:RHS repeat domain-containing protein [Lysobacter sp. yr284]SDZ19813.1 YD repeat-containing protein [Lysobacter sp. yr284]
MTKNLNYPQRGVGSASPRWLHCAICVALWPTLAWGQGNKAPWEEYDKLIQGRGKVVALTADLFGDSVDLASGALSFSATDASVPGNQDGLSVAVSRSFSVGNRKGYGPNELAFADWDIELPRLTGVFATGTGWGSPCTHQGNGQPPLIQQPAYFYPHEYWQGNRMILPGRGSQDMMVANGTVPATPSTGGPYPWLTADLTFFSCLPNQKNAGGEGFLALTSDGTKYWFDWQAQLLEPTLEKTTAGGSSASGNVTYLGRRQVSLYASRVEDRFGNWVSYTYTNAATAPVRLTRIDASDGRALTLEYNAAGHIAKVNEGARSWIYEYSRPSSVATSLSAVVLPDGSRWTLDMAALANATILYEQSTRPEDLVRSCGDPGIVVGPGDLSATLTHPAGARGVFTVGVQRMGRSNVPMVCSNYSTPNNNPNDDVAYYALAYDGFALKKKQLSGPGVTAVEWNYAYGAQISFAPGTGPVCTSGDCGQPRCTSDSCAGTSTTVVQGPESSWTRYTFGNSYRYNEGKLLKIERGSSASAIARTETFRYAWALPGQQFAAPLGSTQQTRGDGFGSEYRRPEIGRSVSQDGVNFDRQVATVDAFARPTQTTRSSSLGFSRTDLSEYYDDTARWVLGQSKRQINQNTGLVVSQVDYHAANALPAKVYAFGRLQQELAYNPDGTVASVKDGKGQATVLSQWKRGIPQAIGYADSTSESASVDDLGLIASTTDENGYSAGYRYDAMGRLAGLTYPSGDSVAWNPMSSDFAASGAAAFGLPAGHWSQVRSEGNKRDRVFFDAYWRPVLEETYDVADRAGTLSQVVKRYDGLGRLVFQSYPLRNVADIGAALPGVRTRYDTLDRPLASEQDSELGVLTTSVEYLSGFQRRTTNPRGYATNERFQVFDEPDFGSPVLIEAPAGVSTTIARDIFGKPLELIRSGPNG